MVSTDPHHKQGSIRLWAALCCPFLLLNLLMLHELTADPSPRWIAIPRPSPHKLDLSASTTTSSQAQQSLDQLHQVRNANNLQTLLHLIPLSSRMCVDLFTWNRLVLSLSDSVRPSLCRQDPGTWSEASYELAHHLYTFSDHLIKFSSTAIPYGNPKHWSGLFGPRVAPLWIIPRCETPWSLASYDIPSESLHPDLHLPLLPLNARAHLHWASANTKTQSQPHRQCTAAHSRTLPPSAKQLQSLFSLHW